MQNHVYFVICTKCIAIAPCDNLRNLIDTKTNIRHAITLLVEFLSDNGAEYCKYSKHVA